jgi:hypothetical protein
LRCEKLNISSFAVGDLSKFKKEFAAFILFLTLVVIYGLWQVPIIDAIVHYSDVKVGGLFIEFKNGTTEPEVMSILEKCNMTINFTIEYKNPIIWYIRFGDGSGNFGAGKSYLLEKDAIQIKNELEKNDRVLKVSFDTLNS